MRWILARAAFPVIFFGALALSLWGLEAGFESGRLVFGIVAGAIVCMALLERVLPYVPSWNQPRGDVGTDTLHMFLTQLGVGRLFDALALGVLAQAASALDQSWGGTIWPSHWPLLLQFLLALVGTDLIRYWLHRASHEVPFLWRFHAVHHSPDRLYWLNAGRFHPHDELTHTAAVAVPLLLLGAPAPVLTLHFVYAGIHGMFQHTNADIRLGPLNYIFPMAELHRWHHSLDITEASSNFGNNIALWDLVFGTYHNPADRQAPAQVGVAGHALPTGYIGQLLAPVRWHRLRR